MKTKRILLLMVMFLFLMIVGANNVFATDVKDSNINNSARTMSEEFKQILNEEGKLVVTDSSNADKIVFLNDYLNKYVPNNSDYFFSINYHNEDFSVCNIARNVFSDDTLSEAYDIEVVFEEKYSEEFKKLTDDGEITITSTSLGEEGILIWNHIKKYATDKYTFNYSSYIIDNQSYYTVSMQDCESYKTIEQHAVNITYKEVFSEEFKKFTTDGNIVITSSGLNGKEDLVRRYCEKFYNTKSGFSYSDFKEDGSACTVSFYKVNEEYAQIVQEQHIVNISYDEKFDERFKKFTEDGNVVIRSSCDTGKNDIIYNYFYSFNGGTDYYFQVMEINTDGTKCVVELYELKENHYPTSKERHVINITYDKTMSEDYKKHLNKDGKLVLNSIKPSNRESLASLIEIFYMSKDMRYASGEISEDLNSINFTAPDSKGIPETHRVEIIYNYNNSTNELAEQVMKDFPHDKEYFEVRDLELINYWLHVGNERDVQGAGKLDNYSSELKSYFKNRNFEMIIDHRAGMDDEFITMRAGIGLLQYDGITYCVKPHVGVLGNHILYVPDDTPSTKEALLEAVQKRVNEYAGEGKVKITAGEGTVVDYYKNYATNKVKQLQDKIDAETSKAEPNEHFISSYKMEMDFYKNDYIDMFLEQYETEGQDYHFLQSAEGDFWFVATINGEDYEFIVIKDSKRMINPKHKTVDLTTNVEISSTSNAVPLDTSIEAQKLTNGTDYNRVIKILNVQDNETFDLKLYSNSLNKYVTKLENGDFEVKLPLPDKFKGNNNLKVYYVDDNEKIHEYNVDVDNGYAIFTTDHFSIYTLAEKITIPEDNKQEDNKQEDNKQEENKEEDNKAGNTNTEMDNNTNTENTDIDNSKNPQTGDNILLYVGMLFIAVIGIVATTRTRKYSKTK